MFPVTAYQQYYPFNISLYQKEKSSIISSFLSNYCKNQLTYFYVTKKISYDTLEDR